ncbi:unnamed protein product [Rhodiola kirilowii]
MDPLSVLRDFTMRGELDEIVRVNDEFRFGSSYAFPCSIETAYRSKQGTRYTLETLVFFIKNPNQRQIDYMQSARAHGVPIVTLPDRKPLLEYLQGVVSSNDAIDFLAIAPASKGGDVANRRPANLEEYRPEDTSVALYSAGRDGEGHGGDDAGAMEGDFDHTLHFMSLIRAAERPLRDRETLLECKHRDFHSVMVQAMHREAERIRLESQQRKDGLVAKRVMGNDDRASGYGDELAFDLGPKPKMLKGGSIGEGVPIILVPSASQTLITIYNVKEFLEDGVYIPTDVKAKQMKGLKPDCITVQKKFSRDRVVAAYEVRDKPSALKKDDWDRVVAVFVLGKEWQFKDWPFKDRVEIFNKVIGFYMRFEDDSVESTKTVKQWNVKIITISKNKRHQDRAAALEVWDRLEEFVRSRSHV